MMRGMAQRCGHGQQATQASSLQTGCGRETARQGGICRQSFEAELQGRAAGRQSSEAAASRLQH